VDRFARDQWYVAAYSAEVGRDLLARMVLGEPLVLYRTGRGEAVALADWCVHRHFPLSGSRRVDDTIVRCLSRSMTSRLTLEL
jgi:phenylpropionate dioxygenase-like ring-hydroxylating dioxygenase large terminal subunit